MAAQDGRDFVLKISGGGSPDVFTTVGGFRTNSLTINNAPVDTSNKSDADKWRRLSAFGAKTMSISGDGIFTDAATERTLLDAAMAGGSGMIEDFQIDMPSFGVFQGQFLVASLTYTGPDNDAVTYSITLESAGTIAFVPA